MGGDKTRLRSAVKVVSCPCNKIRVSIDKYRAMFTNILHFNLTKMIGINEIKVLSRRDVC